MSSAAERLALIQANYDQAARNEPADLAAAQTVAQVTAIQANVALARSTYYGAVAAALSSDTLLAEAAYAAAEAAQGEVAAARQAAAALPDLLAKLVKATEATHHLLQATQAGPLSS